MPPLPSAPARAPELLARLCDLYPGATCSLHWRTPYELLVATMLSAQCTDARVNTVTPALFARFPNAAATAAVEPEALEPYVRSTGFFRQKARRIVASPRRYSCSASGFSMKINSSMSCPMIPELVATRPPPSFSKA